MKRGAGVPGVSRTEKKRGRRASLVLAACLMLTGCGRLPWLGEDVEESALLPAETVPQETVSPESPSQEAASETSSPEASRMVERFCNQDTDRYARDLLSAPQQELYDRMAAAVAAGAESVTAEGLTEEEVAQVGDALRIDWPEFFWLSGDSRWNVWTQNGQVTEIVYYLDYTLEGESLTESLQQAEAAAEAYLAGIESDWSDYEKVKAVYDRVILQTEYQVNQRDQSLYQVLVNGEGVCAGYARTVQYLLNRLGIFCTYVTGTARGGSHAWNLVRLSGEYYYLDATWGDPVFLGEDLPENLVDYRYFCVTTEDLFQTHQPDTWLELPVCTAQECNYYVYSGLLFSGYDPAQWQEAVNRAAAERTAVAVRFTDAASREEARRRLLEEEEIYGMLETAAETAPDLLTNQIRYREEPEGNFLYLYLQYQDAGA